MIRAEARMTLTYDTEDELQRIVSAIPEGINPVIDRILRRVTYTIHQDA